MNVTGLIHPITGDANAHGQNLSQGALRDSDENRREQDKNDLIRCWKNWLLVWNWLGKWIMAYGELGDKFPWELHVGFFSEEILLELTSETSSGSLGKTSNEGFFRRVCRHWNWCLWILFLTRSLLMRKLIIGIRSNIRKW